MSLVGPFTLIRSVSLFHITASFILLTNPRLIAEQAIVVILGEAMGLPPTSTLTKPSETIALCALLLLALGVSDLVSSSLPPLTSLEHWSAQIPVRLCLFFFITAYTYLTKPDGLLGDFSFGSSNKPAFQGIAGFKPDQGAGRFIRNDLVFTAAFVELAVWFWAWVALREERGKLAQQLNERRKVEDELRG